MQKVLQYVCTLPMKHVMEDDLQEGLFDFTIEEAMSILGQAIAASYVTTQMDRMTTTTVWHSTTFFVSFLALVE